MPTAVVAVLAAAEAAGAASATAVPTTPPRVTSEGVASAAVPNGMNTVSVTVTGAVDAPAGRTVIAVATAVPRTVYDRLNWNVRARVAREEQPSVTTTCAGPDVLPKDGMRNVIFATPVPAPNTETSVAGAGLPDPSATVTLTEPTAFVMTTVTSSPAPADGENMVIAALAGHTIASVPHCAIAYAARAAMHAGTSPLEHAAQNAAGTARVQSAETAAVHAGAEVFAATHPPQKLVTPASACMPEVAGRHCDPTAPVTAAAHLDPS